MIDQTSETANRAAQEAAGPPPAASALTDSGLVDQPKSFLKQLLDRVTGVLGGNISGKK